MKDFYFLNVMGFGNEVICNVWVFMLALPCHRKGILRGIVFANSVQQKMMTQMKRSMQDEKVHTIQLYKISICFVLYYYYFYKGAKNIFILIYLC